MGIGLHLDGRRGVRRIFGKGYRMTRRVGSRCGLGGVAGTVCLLLASGGVWAVELPSNMRLDGTIVPSSSKPAVVPAQNDRLLVVNAAKGSLEAVGSVVDGSGTYFVLVSKDTSFNSTPITLRLQKSDSTVYQLLSDGRPVSLPFKGGLFPVRLSLSLSVGSAVGEVAAAQAAAPVPLAENAQGRCENPRMDVNGDGVCDEKDIEILKSYVAGASHTVATTDAKKADVNGDGLVNSRDIVDALKTIRRNAGPASLPAPR